MVISKFTFNKIRTSRPEVFCKISQNSQENTCVRVSCPRPATLLKKRLCHRCFPVSFAKFLRTPCFTEHLWRLLLQNLDIQNTASTVFLNILLFHSNFLGHNKDITKKQSSHVSIPM